MNLIEIKDVLQKKDQKRNQLLGQKEALITTLKKNNISSLEEGEERIQEMEDNLLSKKEQYKQDLDSFMKKYGPLLNK